MERPAFISHLITVCCACGSQPVWLKKWQKLLSEKILSNVWLFNSDFGSWVLISRCAKVCIKWWFFYDTLIETSVDLKKKKKPDLKNFVLPKNVFNLLVECRFWYSVCSKCKNPHTCAHTYMHTLTHAQSRLLQLAYPSCKSEMNGRQFVSLTLENVEPHFSKSKTTSPCWWQGHRANATDSTITHSLTPVTGFFTSRDPVVIADGPGASWFKEEGQPVNHVHPSSSSPHSTAPHSTLSSSFRRACVFLYLSLTHRHSNRHTPAHPWGLYNTSIMKRYFTLGAAEEEEVEYV